VVVCVVFVLLIVVLYLIDFGSFWMVIIMLKIQLSNLAVSSNTWQRVVYCLGGFYWLTLATPCDTW